MISPKFMVVQSWILVLYTVRLSIQANVYPADCLNGCVNGSCCEQQNPHKFQCCPYLNGVCCSGGQFCCPQGSVCSLVHMNCEYVNGRLYTPKRTIEIKAVATETKNAVSCPGRKEVCPKESTCCQMKEGSWGCCKGAQSVCCSDGLHCCPHGTQCNPVNGTCRPLDDPIQRGVLMENIWPWLGPSRNRASEPSNEKERSSFDLMAFNGVLCNDSKHECPPKATCCLDNTSQYACCPMPDAVCCSDGLHCCPKNSKCNIQTQQCDAATTNLEFKPSSQSPIVPPVADSRKLCPGGNATCENGHNCCQLPDKSWGCCPIENGICCEDGLHCCPNGYRCDQVNGMCAKSQQEVVDIEKKITCPNKEFQCDVDSTCCPLPNEEWACCPFANATCCNDKAHCCPEKSTCDVEHDRCVLHNGQSIPVYPRTIPKKRESTSSNICPSGLTSCPGGTCCLDIMGSDMCCPYPDAVCCGNGKHCCPKGHQCEALSGQCIPAKTPISVDQTKMEKTARNEHVKDRLCQDGNRCTGNHTCCLIDMSSYGCCPFDDGVCCNDYRHCCPHGSHCTGSGMCETEGTHPTKSFASYLIGSTPGSFLQHIQPGGLQVSFARETRRARLDPLFLFNNYFIANQHTVRVCPDRERKCSLNEQCCLSAKYGYTCAPKEAVCCSPQWDTYCDLDKTCSVDGAFCQLTY